MNGPIYSDDGYWMWNGTEWIPATQAQNTVPVQQIDQVAVTNIATEVGIEPQQVAAVAPHFDLNQDGVIDQSEMRQAAQSIANPVNMPAPGPNSVPNNMVMPNPTDFTTKSKKIFDWKEKKAILIGGITTIVIAIGVLLFFLLSGNPIIGTWVSDSGEVTYNKDGTVKSAGSEVQTWETNGDNELILTTTSTLTNGSKMTTISTAQYELSDGDDVIWMKIISLVDEDGNDMLTITNPFTGNETKITMPCVVALRDSIAKNSAEYNSTIGTYQDSKPSWCTS